MLSCDQNHVHCRKQPSRPLLPFGKATRNSCRRFLQKPRSHRGHFLERKPPDQGSLANCPPAVKYLPADLFENGVLRDLQALCTLSRAHLSLRTRLSTKSAGAALYTRLQRLQAAETRALVLSFISNGPRSRVSRLSCRVCTSSLLLCAPHRVVSAVRQASVQVCSLPLWLA